MQEEDHGNEYRCPGCVQEREQPGAGEKLPNGVKILQRLGAGRPRRTQAALEDRGEYAILKQALELHTGAYQHPGAHDLQNTKYQQHEARDDGQHQQGRLAAARQYPVEHLQHVKGHHQHQQIEKEAEYRGGHDGRAAGSERLAHF